MWGWDDSTNIMLWKYTGDIFCPLFKPLQTLRPVFGYVLMSWHINLLYAVFCKRTHSQMHLKRLSFHDAMMVCVGSWDKFVLIIWQGHLCTLNCLALTKLTKNGLYVPSLSCLASSLQKKNPAPVALIWRCRIHFTPLTLISNSSGGVKHQCYCSLLANI